jgi:hypothetical protein
MQQARRVFDETTQQPRETLKLRRPVSVRTPGKAWSHQQDLAALKGKIVTLFFLDDSKVEGMLVDADQFTIKVARPAVESKPARIVTFFKHALTGFEPVEG